MSTVSPCSINREFLPLHYAVRALKDGKNLDNRLEVTQDSSKALSELGVIRCIAQKVVGIFERCAHERIADPAGALPLEMFNELYTFLEHNTALQRQFKNDPLHTRLALYYEILKPPESMELLLRKAAAKLSFPEMRWIHHYLVYFISQREFLVHQLILRGFDCAILELLKEIRENDKEIGVSMIMEEAEEKVDILFSISANMCTELQLDTGLLSSLLQKTRAILNFSKTASQEQIKKLLRELLEIRKTEPSCSRLVYALIAIIRTQQLNIVRQRLRSDYQRCKEAELSDEANCNNIRTHKFDSRFVSIESEYRNYKKQFFNYTTPNERPLCSDKDDIIDFKLQVGRAWLEKVRVYSADFNKEHDSILKRYTAGYYKIEEFSKVHSKRQRLSAIFLANLPHPRNYAKIGFDDLVYSDWVIHYVNNGAEDVKKRKVKKKSSTGGSPELSQVTQAMNRLTLDSKNTEGGLVTSKKIEPVGTLEEKRGYSYEDRVARWFDPKRDPLIEDEQYHHIVHQNTRRKIAYFHAFSTRVDAVVLKHGLTEEMAGSSIKYALPCELYFEGSLYRGIVGYCIDKQTGIIWHRCFTTKSQGQLFDEMIKKKFFDFDFPPLGEQILKSSLVLPHEERGENSCHIDYQKSSSKYLTINDPKNNATLTLLLI